MGGARVRKLHDPMHEANRASGGRRVRLATLLQLNGLRGKHGEGGDAPGLWRAQASWTSWSGTVRATPRRWQNW